MTRCVADNEANRRAAGSMLRLSGVVAYPTDTLYGLGAVVTNIHAVGRIFAIKGRLAGQGLPVLVSSVEQLNEVAVEIPTLALEMARRFWPGGLTLVLRKHPSIPGLVTGGQTIAVRQPDHPAPLALIAECGSPITGTSANRSGGPQPTTAQEVVRQLGEAVDLVLDGGPCSSDMPSTVLDLTTDPARVLRVGALAVEALLKVCPVEVSLPTGAQGQQQSGRQA
jgi:L-threonylcarbamoyladenylate synthase